MLLAIFFKVSFNAAPKLSSTMGLALKACLYFFWHHWQNTESKKLIYNYMPITYI
jgi:hypothetical protein